MSHHAARVAYLVKPVGYLVKQDFLYNSYSFTIMLSPVSKRHREAVSGLIIAWK